MIVAHRHDRLDRGRHLDEIAVGHRLRPGQFGREDEAGLRRVAVGLDILRRRFFIAGGGRREEPAAVEPQPLTPKE